VAERITASAFDPTYPLALGWIALEAQVPPTVGLGGVTPPIGMGTTSSIRLQNAMYAVQWICFAAFVLFFWVRMLRDDLRGAAPTPTPSTPVREVY
jgi:cytochrome oxidase assembly protein ShyY1